MKKTIAAIAVAGLTVPVAAQVACEGCDRALELDQQRWNCLLSRLEELSGQPTPVVAFTLSRRNCPALRQVVVPEGQDVPRRKTHFLLSKSQLKCLERIRKRVPGPLYRVDFAAMCGK